MSAINLLPSGYKPKSRFRVSVVLVLVAFLVCVGYLGNLMYLANLEKSVLESELQILESQIQSLSELSSLQNRLNTIKIETESIKTDYQNGRLYESAVLNLIETVIPAKMDIESILISNNGTVELSGCVARSYNVVTQLMQNIKDASIIRNVELSSIVRAKSVISEAVSSSFPLRGSEYVTVGSLSTTDLFSDTYSFSIKFSVVSE